MKREAFAEGNLASLKKYLKCTEKLGVYAITGLADFIDVVDSVTGHISGRASYISEVAPYNDPQA